MKQQGCNPYLPAWEYVPDGEPHVFEGRVYVYGSHDRFGGYAYCLNDYVGWSAPVDDLTSWRCEGVLYTRRDDPANPDGDMVLFAPDVARGPDGRYYLYYVLDQLPVVSVAVCDTPAGRYRFLGYVHYPDGTRLGEAPRDEAQFDPAVLVEQEKVYLYTGFCMPDSKNRHGAMATELESDMLTVRSGPVFVLPSAPYAAHTSFAGHAYFEAPSIRRVAGRYCLVYSSVWQHELCYATAEAPLGPFAFRGAIVSNSDLGVDTYKPAGQPMFYGANNHGGLVCAEGQWYIFYHRHTNGTNFSRQGCIEPVQVRQDGFIAQVEMTSSGANNGPLEGSGTYPAHLACNLFCPAPASTTGGPGDWMDCRFPKITQDGPDGTECRLYVANMREGATAGFKYFFCRHVSRVALEVRGVGGLFEIKTAWDGPPLGKIVVGHSNEWKRYEGAAAIPDGVQALYFTYRGDGWMSLASFTLE